jgi:ribonuclease D
MDIHTFAEQKRHWIKGIRNGFSIEKYFDLRKSFVLPSIAVSSYSRKQSKTKIKSRNPELLAQLFELRNSVVDESGLPIYLIANSKTIMEMADFLPQNKADMLKISGIGEAKYERFGGPFLEIIQNYCEENGIESSMEELFDRVKRERKPKKPKGASALETLEAFKLGKSVREIARERNLAVGTISGHLAEFVMKGEVDAERIVGKEKLLKAKELVENTEYDGSVYGLLKEHFEAGELSIILGWLRSNA